ncbi:MAG: aspartate racemase [Pyrinomonadaceae bacterium]|jgi:aspartate racemase|nr:aspartate racemase [Pyrinomonadaceae bacterium]
MSNTLTIGILGGMGPEATNQLCALITGHTLVGKDQDHIPVITFNNSSIPDRVAAARGVGESPVPEMIRTARVLEQAGADFLVMPCNLAHYFLPDVQAAVSVPILDMIEETVRHIAEHYPQCGRAGILASTPTLESSLYHESFQKHGKRLLVPAADEQAGKVMKAIYGEEGIKCGYKDAPRVLLTEAAERLVAAGAEVIIAGCTEVSLVLTSDNSPFPVIDPLDIIARAAVARATAGDGERVRPETSAASLIG